MKINRGLDCEPVVSSFRLYRKKPEYLFPEGVTNAFSYISPAVFGAIIIDYCMKNWKQNLPLIAVGFAVFIILSRFGVSSVWKNLAVLIIGMFVSRIIYKIMNSKKQAHGTATS